MALSVQTASKSALKPHWSALQTECRQLEGVGNSRTHISITTYSATRHTQLPRATHHHLSKNSNPGRARNRIQVHRIPFRTVRLDLIMTGVRLMAHSPIRTTSNREGKCFWPRRLVAIKLVASILTSCTNLCKKLFSRRRPWPRRKRRWIYKARVRRDWHSNP